MPRNGRMELGSHAQKQKDNKGRFRVNE